MSAWQEVSIVSVYVMTLIAFVYCSETLVLSIREILDDRYEYRYALRVKNTILIQVTESALTRAKYFCGLSIGFFLLSLTAAIYIYLVPPLPDTSFLQTFFRVDYVFIVWCARMVKRTDRKRRHRRRQGRA